MRGFCAGAGTPFVVLNTLCGALAAYGLAGLRYTLKHIVLYALIIVLQSLIAIQLLIFSVYATPNQVRLPAHTAKPCESAVFQHSYCNIVCAMTCFQGALFGYVR